MTAKPTMKIKAFLISAILFLSVPSFAQIETMSEESRDILNQQLRYSQRRLNAIENGISLTSGVAGILPLANGGTARALTDPGADRIMFWDESSNYFDFLTVSTGLALIGSALTADEDVNKKTQVVMTTASNSGDIPVTVNKKYLIFVNLTNVSTNLTLYLRFNSDSTATSYKWQIDETTFSATPSAPTLTGDNSDAQISLGAIDAVNTIMLVFDNTAFGAWVFIEGRGTISGGGTFRKFAGSYTFAADVTSFELVTSTGTITGTVDYYEFN